jgi:hypothetical protein
MSESARWVCHTCKTVCDRGGRVAAKGIFSTRQVELARLLLKRAHEVFEFDELVEDISRYLADFEKWLSRHESHNIHIGSDYTTDMMDLCDYFNETVGGAKSDVTRLELASRNADRWRSAGIDKVKSIILAHKSKGAYGIVIDVDGAAEALYNQYCIDIAIEQGG